MHFPTLLTGLGSMASAASAAPYTLSSRAASGQNVVYWGQNGGGTIESNDLATYCTSSSGIDIIVLAFLYEYGNGNNIPSGTIWSEALIIYGIHEYIAILSRKMRVRPCQGSQTPTNRSLYIECFVPTNLQLTRASKQHSNFATYIDEF